MELFFIDVGFCGQFWQKSIAWNWGGKHYLFKIPETTTDDWLKEQFMSPAEMLIYSSLMAEYLKMNKFIESKTRCQNEECDRVAIEKNVLCKHHLWKVYSDLDCYLRTRKERYSSLIPSDTLDRLALSSKCPRIAQLCHRLA